MMRTIISTCKDELSYYSVQVPCLTVYCQYVIQVRKADTMMCFLVDT